MGCRRWLDRCRAPSTSSCNTQTRTRSSLKPHNPVSTNRGQGQPASNQITRRRDACLLRKPKSAQAQPDRGRERHGKDAAEKACLQSKTPLSRLVTGSAANTAAHSAGAKQMSAYGLGIVVSALAAGERVRHYRRSNKGVYGSHSSVVSCSRSVKSEPG